MGYGHHILDAIIYTLVQAYVIINFLKLLIKSHFAQSAI